MRFSFQGVQIAIAITCAFAPSCTAGMSAWQKDMDEGKAAFLAKDYHKAESAYDAAIKQAEKFHEDDPRLVDALMGLANAYAQDGSFVSPDTLYERALIIEEKTAGENSLEVASILQSMGSLERRFREYAKAEKHLRRAFDIRQKKPPDTALAESAMELGDTLMLTVHDRPENKSVGDSTLSSDKARRITDAENLYKKAVAIFEQNTQDQRGLADACYRLSTLYSYSQKYDLATPLCKRALDARQKTLGQNSPLVAESLDALSMDYAMQGSFDEAEPYVDRALDIWKTVPANSSGVDTKTAAITLNNLGAVFLHNHRDTTALAIWTAAIGLDPDFPLPYSNRAIVKRKRGDIRGAQMDLARASRLEPTKTKR